MIWPGGCACLRRPSASYRPSCGVLRSFARRVVTPLCALALLLTAPGCCSTSSSPGMTEDRPTLPVLTSLQRLELNGVPGVWMDDADAGRLALWIYDVTGIDGDDSNY